MKYLIVVLIALFCVGCQEDNLSDATIKQFLDLDENIKINTRIIENSTHSNIAYLEEMARFKIKMEPVLNKTMEFNTKTNTFCRYVEKIRKYLIEESNSADNKEFVKDSSSILFYPKDKDTPYRIFLFNNNEIGKEPIGLALEKKILELKKAYISELEKLWDNGGIAKGSIFTDSSKKEQAIKELIKEIPFFDDKKYLLDANNQGKWAKSVFENMPVVAVCLMLRKLENDVKIAGLEMVNFLAYQWSCDLFVQMKMKPEIISVPNAPTIHLGETYTNSIVLGKYYDSAIFSVIIDNETIESVNGIATYKVKPSSIGTKKYTAKVVYKNHYTDEMETTTQNFYYEVVN